MITKQFQIIIIAVILSSVNSFKIFGFPSTLYCSKNECGLNLSKKNIYGKDITFVRPYRIFNDINFMMKVIPHIAMDVKICKKNNCEITSYGKGNNGKIYSPDIFTNGRKCDKNTKKCKNINKGYWKNNITDWIEIPQKYNKSFFSFINNETIYKTKYNLFSNNCASFVSQSLKKANLSFGCRFGFIDLPLYCGI